MDTAASPLLVGGVSVNVPLIELVMFWGYSSVTANCEFVVRLLGTLK